MPKTPGINGIGVASVAAGTLLIYFGIKDVPLGDGIKAMLRGVDPSTAARGKVQFDKTGTFGPDPAAPGQAIFIGGSSITDRVPCPGVGPNHSQAPGKFTEKWACNEQTKKWTRLS